MLIQISMFVQDQLIFMLTMEKPRDTVAKTKEKDP